jgi:hypothetical protein
MIRGIFLKDPFYLYYNSAMRKTIFAYFLLLGTFVNSKDLEHLAHQESEERAHVAAKYPYRVVPWTHFDLRCLCIFP